MTDGEFDEFLRKMRASGVRRMEFDGSGLRTVELYESGPAAPEPTPEPEARRAAPPVDAPRGPDGLTAEEQEALYGAVYDAPAAPEA